MGRKTTVFTDQYEREVVQSLANDKRVRELAEFGSISAKAMDSRITKIRQRYGFKSIAALCVHFLREGWIS